LSYDERQVDDWTQLRDLLESLSQTRRWIFRGQRCASWELKTSLQRHVPQNSDLEAAEQKLFGEFKRRAHTYLAQQLIPKDNDDDGEGEGEWLSLMQHFGAPTRLLDMTNSPYVATYFAVEDESSESHCAVWAIDQRWCLDAAGIVMIEQSEPGVREKFKQQPAAMIVPSPGNHIAHARIRLLRAGLLIKLWMEERLPCVVPYTPNRLSERMSAQQGTFLLPRDVTKPFMECLNTMPDVRQGVVKITIPADHATRGTILERLRAMNIQRASLFPGLEGFAQSFRTLLLEEPEHVRSMRDAKAALDSLKRMLKEKPEDSADDDEEPPAGVGT